MRKLYTDCLVIGSGPSGCVTALTLAEAGREVTMIEEGNSIITPPFSFEEMKEKYRHGGINACFGDRMGFAEGRCLGGGSEVNSGLYHRLPNQIADEWANDYGVKDLSQQQLAPHFEWVEGLLNLKKTEPLSKSSQRLEAAAKKLGWEGENVIRWVTPKSEGQSFKRHSMSEVCIPKIKACGGTVVTETRAVYIKKIREGWDVTTIDSQQNKILYSTKVLFLCGGSIMTPFLLLKSGITSHVGTSLRFHPFIKCMAEFDTVVNDNDRDMGTYQIKQFSPQICIGSSISTTPFLKMASLDYQKVETPLYPQNTAIFYASFRAEAKGRITALPFLSDPLVRYKLTQSDWVLATEAKNVLIQALFSAGAKRVFPFYQPGVDHKVLKSEQESGAFKIKTSFLTSVHMMGSCAMGNNPQTSATDSFGNIWNKNNLIINDASLFCTAIGVNPQGAVMAMARRNTLRFLS